MLLIGREERHLHTPAATKDEDIPLQIQDALVAAHQIQSQQQYPFVDVQHNEIHVELHVAGAQGANDIGNPPDDVGLAHARCHTSPRSIDPIHQPQLLRQRDGYDAALGPGIDHHFHTHSVSEDTRCQTHVRLVATGRDRPEWISLIGVCVAGAPSRRNVGGWRTSRAVGAGIPLTHDTAIGSIVMAQGSMAQLARNSLGVAHKELAQVVKSWTGDDGIWSGNGSAEDSSWPSPSARGSWRNTDTKRIGIRSIAVG
mmetsp:Transcript_18848/g.54333  ORF Transcript_18848/g.54333 Transcript_18848/m.54333 type:complete len:256 (-) Transcript_18848:229-996(-)